MDTVGERPARLLVVDIMGIVVRVEMAIEQNNITLALIEPGYGLPEPLFGEAISQPQA